MVTEHVEPDKELTAMGMMRRVMDRATVRTVFGDPIERDGVTVIPVARVAGRAGGGGGTGTGTCYCGDPAAAEDNPAAGEQAGTATVSGEDAEPEVAAGEEAANGPAAAACTGWGKGTGTGTGSGGGFVMSAKPIGAFVITGGDARWRPAIDVNRVIMGGQILGAIALLTLRALIRSRRR